MITDTQKRQIILRRISRIPLEKLTELDNLISKFDNEIIKKTKTLSFAGAWKSIDDSVFTELTDKLISNRQKNKRRIDG